MFEGISFKGDFLKQKATRQLFSVEQHLPSAVIDRGSVRSWQEEGKTDAFERAKTRTQLLLKDYRRPELSAAQLEELTKMVSRLGEDAGMPGLPGV